MCEAEKKVIADLTKLTQDLMVDLAKNRLLQEMWIYRNRLREAMKGVR